MLLLPAASQATARTIPSFGAFGTFASPAARASYTSLRVPKRSVTVAGSLSQSLRGLRWRILTLGARVSALNGTATVVVAKASIASMTASYSPSTSRPTRFAPSHSSFCVPGSSWPLNGVAIHLPCLRIRSRICAGAVSSKLNPIRSPRPSALGENASRGAVTLPRVRLTTNCVEAVA